MRERERERERKRERERERERVSERGVVCEYACRVNKENCVKLRRFSVLGGR